MAIHLHQNDLPKGLDFGKTVAIDTETTGLNHGRDRLCLVQLSAGDGDAHLVRIAQHRKTPVPAPRLKALLGNAGLEKLFHFARFDVAVLTNHIGPIKGTIYCTKIASKIARTYTDKHSLESLCGELLDLQISKQKQSSDWAGEPLGDEQLAYAAGDVLHLHGIRKRLDAMLRREGRHDMARACMDFIAMRARMDLAGYGEIDIFAH